MRLEEMNTSEFNEAQKHLYHVAMNMKMQGKIAPDGIGHFEAAIEALSDNEIPYEESELAIDYLEKMKNDYVEGFGYEAHPLPEYYAIETAVKALEKVNWYAKKVDELARKLEKVEKVVSEWQEDPERDIEAFDSMRELCDIVLDNSQEEHIIDEDVER